MKMTRYKNSLVAFSFLVFTVIGVNAQDQDTDAVGGMVTDRPDATESPSVVPKGYLQVETGGFYESFEENNTTLERTVYNTSLLRYGVLENLELRVGWNFEDQKITGQENSVSGLSPLLFGLKLAIAEEKNGWPEVGFIGHLFLPFTASTDFKPETTGADFRFSVSHTLSENTNLSYNFGAQWGADSPEIAYIYTIAYGIGLSDKIGFYAELYGDLPENSSANHFWDTGFTWLMQPNIQFDATVGTSITQGQDILLSAGLSFRIPG